MADVSSADLPTIAPTRSSSLFTELRRSNATSLKSNNCFVGLAVANLSGLRSSKMCWRKCVLVLSLSEASASSIISTRRFRAINSPLSHSTFSDESILKKSFWWCDVDVCPPELLAYAPELLAIAQATGRWMRSKRK